MKTLKRILWAAAALAMLASVVLFLYGLAVKDRPMDEKNLTLVAAGPGYKEAESEKALEKGLIAAEASASVQVSGYSPAFAVDGDIETYWEGMGEYPQYFTLSLNEKATVSRMVLKLNPIEIWGKRTQSFAVEASDDGENYTVVIPDTAYTFDWSEGNSVEIRWTDAGLQTQYIRLVFSANASAGGGQIAEAELYGE